MTPGGEPGVGATIAGVLFDFDGTITEHGVLDFDRIRREIGCPPGGHILRYIAGLEPDARRRAEETLLRHERQAAAVSRPTNGAEELLLELKSRGLRLGVLTRNTRDSVVRALGNFSRITTESFDLVITRDDELARKPEPDGVVYAARTWEVPPERIVVVGDYKDDIAAGRAAGAMTVHFDAGLPYPPDASPPDARVRTMAELRSFFMRRLE